MIVSETVSRQTIAVQVATFPRYAQDVDADLNDVLAVERKRIYVPDAKRSYIYAKGFLLDLEQQIGNSVLTVQ